MAILFFVLLIVLLFVYYGVVVFTLIFHNFDYKSEFLFALIPFQIWAKMLYDSYIILN